MKNLISLLLVFMVFACQPSADDPDASAVTRHESTVPVFRTSWTLESGFVFSPAETRQLDRLSEADLWALGPDSSGISLPLHEDPRDDHVWFSWLDPQIPESIAPGTRLSVISMGNGREVARLRIVPQARPTQPFSGTQAQRTCWYACEDRIGPAACDWASACPPGWGIGSYVREETSQCDDVPGECLHCQHSGAVCDGTGDYYCWESHWTTQCQPPG